MKNVKIMHDKREADTEDWWEEMPDNVKEDVEEALLQADHGEGLPHDEIKKRYSNWFAD